MPAKETSNVKPKILVAQTPKIKNRYNQLNVKNKKSQIPFAKLNQPNYIQHNRFGTVNEMQ